MPNVIVTPHVSGLGPGLWERAMALFARNLSAFLEGRTLENMIDKRTGY
jgi:phosphoglycerate dehydrogenase-like enzyme